MTISNTLTDLQGEIYSAIDVVSREPIGFLPSIQLNGAASRVQKGDSAKVPISAATTGVDITPAMTVPEPTDKTTSYRNITISKSRAYAFGITGEERQGLNNGMGFPSWQSAEIGQAIRGLINEMEEDAADLVIQACRAYGTAGTTPFASDLTDAANIMKILQDNGAPVRAGWNMVLNTTAGAKLRAMGLFTKANEAGSTTFRDQGMFADIFGARIRESGQISAHTKGTGASATTDDTGYAVGSTTITLASAGTGTILAGDVITFAGDTNKYVVKTGDADVSGGGTIVLREPGLQVAIGEAATAITVGASYTPNVGFTPDAIQLAARLPALPQEGDSAIDRMAVTDPMSGIVYEFAIYPGYRQNRYEVSAAWGVAMTKEEHAAILLG